MGKIKATTDGKKGGILYGKSHAQGGIKAVVTDAGNKEVELEGGEAIIKESALKDKTVKTLTGTNAQILNLINTRAGGNPIYAPSEVKMKNGGRVGSDDFSDIESLISKGIVEIEYEKSTEKHAKEYGLQCKKPLYLKRIYVRKDYRLKGVGKRVLKYLDYIAQKNSNDCIFGYVSNKVIFTKDNRDVNYNDVQLFKFWLHENGYAINDDNNDFHKVISLKMAKGGSDEFKGSTISDKTINEETDFIAEYLEDNGFFIRRGARSRTDFGESNYLYAHNKVDEGGFPMGDGVKIRISDHSVSNFDRMYNEIHVGITDTKESWEKSAFSVLMQLQWQYDKNNKYRKEDAVEIKKVTVEIPESQLRINPPYADKILSERISNNGKKLLTVERTYSNSIEKWYHKESGTYYTTIKPNVFDKGGSIDNEDNIKNKWKSVGKMAKGGSIEDNCISFIKNSEAIKNNGYFHYFKNISIYADFGTKVPKTKSFYLCAYNSGGQKNLKVTDTLNLDLINKLQEIIDCEKSICRIIVDEFFRKAKRIESNDLSRMTGENIIVVDRYNIVCDNIKNEFSSGGSITPSAINKMTKAEQKAFYKTKEGKELDKQTYTKWKSLVNMSKGELESFYNSKEGKEAGLSASEAKAEGIDSGRESARWIMKMKDIPYTEWTSNMWVWAKKQISFVSRMKGMRGDLYDDKGNKTRKHLALLIWGHNPKKMAEGGVIPQQGTLFTKDKKNKLDYKKVGNDYVFKVYDVESNPVESNPVENYTRHQYKKRNNNEATMDYNQFINYLYSEHYIDDKKMAEGGVTGDVFSIKDPEQFKQLITLYNKFSEKFDVDNYFVDDSSVVFLRKVKFTDAELKGMAQYIADLSKNQNFSIISDKKPEISNGYFKFFLKERVRYKDGGNVEEQKELFHYSSEQNIERIIENNFLQSSVRYKGISFTTDENYHKGYFGLDYGNTRARIVLDNDKLIADGFIGEYFDHNTNSNVKGKESEYKISDDILVYKNPTQRQHDNKIGIPNIKKYIKRVELFDVLGEIDVNKTKDTNKYYFNEMAEGGNVGGGLDKFKDIILESKNFDSAFTKAKLIKNVPKETANYFSEKYNPQDNLSMEEAFRKMYNEVKGIKGDFVSQLKKGIKVEKEHEKTFKKVAKGKISVKDAIKETAEEHIAENPNYYDELELVDGEKKKEKFGDINVSRHKDGSKIAIRVYDTKTNELMILFYPSFLYPKKLTNKMAAEQMRSNQMTKQEKEYYEKKKNGTKFKEIPLPFESEDEIDLELLMKEAEMNVAKSKRGKKPTQKDIDEEFHRLLMEK